jgi:hypothetical protein
MLSHLTLPEQHAVHSLTGGTYSWQLYRIIYCPHKPTRTTGNPALYRVLDALLSVETCKLNLASSNVGRMENGLMRVVVVHMGNNVFLCSPQWHSAGVFIDNRGSALPC